MTEISWLVLPKPVLLLSEVVIEIMDNPTNKLAVFCTTGRLTQEVGQIIVCPNVSNQCTFLMVDSGQEELVTWDLLSP